MRNLSWLILITLVVTVYLTSVASAGLNDGLLIYLPFDDRAGQDASDKSGNGNDAKTRSRVPNGNRMPVRLAAQ